MMAVASAQGPPMAASQEQVDAAADGSVLSPEGSVLLPPTSTEGTLKFVHSMVATQADMISEMVNKVSFCGSKEEGSCLFYQRCGWAVAHQPSNHPSLCTPSTQIHPDLHGPLMGLTTMMMAAQEQIPNILSGKPPTEPSALVHEMFVRYANGTKTDADLAQISQGLDELFTHKYDASDADKALNLINAKDLFVDKTPKPQLIANATLNWTAPAVKAWTQPNFTKPLPYLTANKINFTAAPVTKFDNAAAAKYADWNASAVQIAAAQAKWDKANAAAIQPTPGQLSTSGGLYKKELAMATAVGNAYKNKDPKLTPYPSDWMPGKTTAGNAFWRTADNQTALLALSGALLGANKNISQLPPPSIKPVNIYKDNQNAILAEDAIKLNLTRTAFPTKQGFDWLRPAIDVATSDPIGDAVAPALAYAEFRDPTLFGVSNSKTTVSTKYNTGAKGIFDPSANTTLLRKDNLKYNYNMGNGQNKINLLSVGGSLFQYRPCIMSESYTGAAASAELIRIRPEAIGISASGANVDPMLIDINPHVIKVQAQGVQYNPDLINIEPYVISIAPRVNLAGKAQPKPWQKDRPGAPAKSNLYKSQGGFKEDPAVAARKTLQPPVGKPYT